MCLSCLGLVAVLSACPPASVPPPPPPPPVTSSSPSTPIGGLVVRQTGLPDIPLNRAVLDVSVSDLESAYGAGETFVLKGITDSCGLAIREDLGIAAMTDSNLAVVGVVVERPDAATPEGIAVGDPVEKVLSTYGSQATGTASRPSATGGPLLLVGDLSSPGETPGLQSLGYGFDTDASGTVTRIRAGFYPYVTYAAYCADEAGRPESVGWPLT